MPPPRGLVQQLDQLLHRRMWLERGARVLVACSGGADSVALLRLLAAVNGSDYWGWKLVVGHVDHGLRGKASAGDAAFVKKLGKKLGLTVAVRKVKVSRNRQGQASEAAAREARLKALAAMARRYRCGVIVLAHHADDQAETVLMRLLRGTGVTGMAAMAERKRMRVGKGAVTLVRPLLGFTRMQLREYLAEAGQEFREDASNASDAYLRNRVRRELLPLLETYQPGVRKVLGRLAHHARELRQVVRRECRGMVRAGVMERDGRRLVMRLDMLKRCSSAARGMMLRQGLTEMGVGADAIGHEPLQVALRAIKDGKTGCQVQFAGEVMVRVTRTHVEIVRHEIKRQKGRKHEVPKPRRTTKTKGESDK